MALFLSTYINKIDRKGRVSVPAPFRVALAAEGVDGAAAGLGVVLFRATAHLCVEGVAVPLMEEIGARLDHYDLFSAEQDDMALSVFGESVHLPIDAEGRMILPAELIEYAGLGDQAAFVGMGRKFQIWAPEALETRKVAARKSVQDQGLTLPRAESGKVGKGGAQ